MPDFRFLDETEEQDHEDESVDTDPSEDLYFEEDLSEVENRLEEANCYKALLRSPLFGEDSPAIAEQVEAKVKQFIRNELGVLLGLYAPKLVAVETKQFTKEEEDLLKTWAGVLKGRPHLMNGKAQSGPEVNVATVSKAPEISTATVAAKPVAVVQPVAVKQPRKPRAKPTPKAPKKETKEEKSKNVITRKIMVNGVEAEVEMNIGRQTMPAPGTVGYNAPLDPESSAMYKERMALTNGPTGLVKAAASQAALLGD